jgi:(p)ppGpp synthase/HD superfamily hydrolase
MINSEEDRARAEEDRARVIAQGAHGDQKYGSEPYVVHLAAVRSVLAEYGFAGDLLVAAWLHDVLEDTKTSVKDLTTAFGSKVACLVVTVTGRGSNRKERNASIYNQVAGHPPALPLKLADRIANGRTCVKRGDAELLAMYQGEYPEFRAALYPLSRDCEVLWRELDKIMTPARSSTPPGRPSTPPPAPTVTPSTPPGRPSTPPGRPV